MKKKYDSPIALENDILAEAIYASSGDVINNDTPTTTQPTIDYDNDPNCWTVGVSKSQVVMHEGYVNFRVQANHPNTVKHISEQSIVTIVFNQPITDGSFEGFGFESNGCTVILTRVQHANAYNSADQYNSLLKVYCENPDSLEVIDSSIACTHIPNVQDEFD